MGAKKVVLVFVPFAVLVALASCSSGDDDTAADSEPDVAELQDQLDAAESRAEKAESERDKLAAELQAAQDQLTELTQATATTAQSTDPPANTAATTPSTSAATDAPTTVAETTPTTTPSTGQPAAPDASLYVEAIGDISTLELPVGDPGAVSVVTVAAALDRTGSLPLVVRNNTTKSVGAIDVTGIARDSSGGLAASGSSQGFKPVVVAPGEIAYGYIYFGDGVPADATFELSVSADPVDEYFMPVLITELSANTDQIVGILTNDTGTHVSGPIGVDAICFESSGNTIVSTQGSYAEQDDLAPGATGSFSIDLFGDPCPRGLISASGYGF